MRIHFGKLHTGKQRENNRLDYEKPFCVTARATLNVKKQLCCVQFVGGKNLLMRCLFSTKDVFIFHRVIFIKTAAKDLSILR